MEDHTLVWVCLYLRLGVLVHLPAGHWNGTKPYTLKTLEPWILKCL